MYDWTNSIPLVVVVVMVVVVPAVDPVLVG